MLSILILKEFEQYFMEMIPITELIAKEYLLEEKVYQYMAGLVQLSQKYNMPFSSDIAILQSEVLNYIPDAQTSKKYERKQKRQYFLNCLKKAKSYADDYFLKTRQLLEESSILLTKVAAVAVSKNLLEQQTNIDVLIAKMKQDDELMPALTSAIGTVGYFNMRYLLEQAIAAVNSSQ